MRTILYLFVFAGFVTMGFTDCSKKKSGVCYCKYVSGDKKEFDLSSLERNRAQDSCNVLDNNANTFGGDCDLK